MLTFPLQILDDALREGAKLQSFFVSKDRPRIVIVSKDGSEIGRGIDNCVLQAIYLCNAKIANPFKKEPPTGTYYSEQSKEPLGIWLSTKNFEAKEKNGLIHCSISDPHTKKVYHGDEHSFLSAIRSAFNTSKIPEVEKIK